MVIQKKLMFFVLSALCLCTVNDSSAETWAEYALNKASEWGYSPVVSSLLRFGVDPKAVSSKTTALIKASENGHADVVNVLLLAGAADSHEDAELALCKASERGHSRVVSSLLNDGVDPEAVTTTEALITAAKNGHADVINLLPEPDRAEHLRATVAFMLAVKEGHSETVEAFLKWRQTIGVDARLYGMTAFDVALGHGNHEVARLLLNHGATPSADEDIAAVILEKKEMEQIGADEAAVILAEHLKRQRIFMAESLSSIQDRKEVLKQASGMSGDAIGLGLSMLYGNETKKAIVRDRNLKLQREADNIEGLE